MIGLGILAFVLVLLWFSSLYRKGKRGPSHIELYFDENFRKIMAEWDLVTRDKVKVFKKEMSDRLEKIGGDISNLEKRRKDLDKRLSAVEKGMERMERF
jgi:hypothetical protein